MVASASSAPIGGGVSIQHGQRGYVDFFEMQMQQLAEQQQQFYNERTQTPPRPPISSLASTPSSSGSGRDGQQIVMNHPTHSGNSNRKRRFHQTTTTPGLAMSYDHNQPQQQPHSFFTQPNNGGPHSSSKRPRIGLVSCSSVPPWIQKTLADEARHFADRDTQQNPLFEKATRNSILEMRQESAFIDSLDPSIADNLGHSKRLLNTEINKIDAQLNPDWLELDNRTIKLSRQVLIPIHRHPTINFVGRILGHRGSTLNRICKKYKCYVAILGANSTKNRKQELQMLNSGDSRYQHFGSPLHVRIDLFAPAHIAHMRMGAVLNLFHKMLQPDYFNVEEFLGNVDLAYNEEKDSRPRTKEARSNKINKEMHDLEAEFQLDQLQQKVEPKEEDAQRELGSQDGQPQNAVEVYSPNPDEQIGRENHNNTVSNNIPPPQEQPQQDPQKQKPVGNTEEENNDGKQPSKADLVEEKEKQEEEKPKPSESLPNLSDAPSTSSASFPPAFPTGSARGGGRGRGGGFVPKGMRERILQMQRAQQQRMAVEERAEPEEKADQSDGDY